uniref:ATP-dependent DNA helicase n=1 Tax=Tanacetum cinerariifolium TaxID=118510 RepID=A0A6L2P3K4_TANCI|nr:DNA helicase [Tanacetum cinerariifolium]
MMKLSKIRDNEIRMISKIEDKINPRKKRLNLEEAKGQELRNHLALVCFFYDDVDQFGDSSIRQNTVAPQQGANTGGGNVMTHLFARSADLVDATTMPVSSIFDRQFIPVDTPSERESAKDGQAINGSLKDSSKTAANQRLTFSSRTAGDSRALLVANSKESLANPGVTTPSVEDVSYIDLGNCDQKCHYCGCLFCYAEWLKGANHFMEQIRAYNKMFAMTSFGAKVDDSVNKRRGPYVFKVSGQIYRWIGSLCLEEVHDLRFLQLYIYDTQDEVANRICSAGDIPGMKIKLYSMGGIRGYKLPSSDLLGGIVFYDSPKSRMDFDVVIQLRGGPPQRIKKEHQSYMSLQYPLLFVFGQPGFYPEMVLKPKDCSGQVFCAIEQYRLDWVRKNQKELRSDYLLGLYDAVSKGDREGIQVGSMVMLPRTFTGGPRFVYNRVLEKRFAALSYAFIVTELMMHGPCGVGIPMQRVRKTKSAARNFQKSIMTTLFYTNEHTHYWRRQTEIHFMTGESRLDNYNVVPYNQKLSLAFHAHINVEYYGWSMLIKYLFKYISKGPDRILAKVSKSIGDMSTSTDNQLMEVDKIKNYVDGRFVSLFEACGRIFDYPIHCREPAVQILNVHLENMQRVSFRNRDRIDIIVNMPEKKKMTLTEWYVYYDQNTDGRHLTYLDFPSEFAWSAKTKSWHQRVIKTKKYGRLTYVHPSSGDLFYFRMLLCHKKGCKSPDEVQTINGKLLPTYRVTCEALGLLGDNKEWDVALEESTMLATSAKLRMLFAQILVYCGVADPMKLWMKHWCAMQDDIPSKVSDVTDIPKFRKSVNDFGLSLPPWDMLEDLKNKILMEKRNYRRDLLSRDVIELVPKLNRDQKEVFILITTAFEEGRQELLFVYGHGGIGKTCLWKTITSLERSQGKIVLAVASSGIASLLLPARRTAHFRRCFEALDRTLRDLMSAPEIVFGGKTVILGVYMLRENMILLRSDLSDEQRKRSEVFAKWLFDVGNGEIGDNDHQDDEDTSHITVLQEYCINVDKEGLSKLINFIYDDATLKAPTASTLQEKVIVCPKNDTTDEVNAKILSSTKGVMKTYLSKDEAIPLGKQTSETEMLYPMEYLNTLTFPGFSPHALQLNVGTPIMML